VSHAHHTNDTYTTAIIPNSRRAVLAVPSLSMETVKTFMIPC